MAEKKGPLTEREVQGASWRGITSSRARWASTP